MRNLILISVLVFSGMNINAQDASTILAKMDKTILAVKDKSADVEMEMTNLNTGKGNVKKATLLQKGADKKIFRYTFPKSDAGIATLTLPDAVYLYLPMFKKPKKITNMAQSNTFNKSDFSLSDAALLPYSDNFVPALKETTDKDYVLELKPKNSEIDYSRLLVYVNKSNYYPDKIVYFDKKGSKLKEADYKYKKIGNYWVADVITMINVKKNHKTVIKMTNIKINQGLKDSDFTVEKITPVKK
ncbi:MAG: outer membrane lipoprotein-sorting protein [Chlorobi bacterium]|nr:outer membrane lipoprotein-sorting protein [Chlorobiota bacterium]